MKAFSIKTRAMNPPQDDLMEVLKESLKGQIQEGDILCVASKVVSIGEGNCVLDSDISKDDLIQREAERFIPRKECPNEYVILTIKHNTVISSAGIDRSSGNGYFILWPKDPFASAKRIHEFIQKEFNVQNFGVIVTDSSSSPLRAGTVGVSIGFHGFHPLKNYIGKPDVFGRPMEVTRLNWVDNIASTAVMLMGEGDEQTPLAVVRGIQGIDFVNQDTRDEILIDVEDDMFYPLLKNFKKIPQV